MNTAERKDQRRGRRKMYGASVRVRCTPEEHRAIMANARLAKRSASRFLVELGTRHPGDMIVAGPSAEELQIIEGLMFQLHRIGVNLNQLVRHQHSFVEDGSTVVQPEPGLQDLVRSVAGLLEQLRERIR